MVFKKIVVFVLMLASSSHRSHFGCVSQLALLLFNTTCHSIMTTGSQHDDEKGCILEKTSSIQIFSMEQCEIVTLSKYMAYAIPVLRYVLQFISLSSSKGVLMMIAFRPQCSSISVNKRNCGVGIFRKASQDAINQLLTYCQQASQPMSVSHQVAKHYFFTRGHVKHEFVTQLASSLASKPSNVVSLTSQLE